METNFSMIFLLRFTKSTIQRINTKKLEKVAILQTKRIYRKINRRERVNSASTLSQHSNNK